MRDSAHITSSWDDGHPLDLQVAELLAKHDVRGTFYVPKRSERATMSGQQIRELGSAFELGAHTLNHVVLTRASDEFAQSEIDGGKRWLEDQSGNPCVMFCPPTGKYARRHLEMIRRSGYIGLRSVEFGSLDFPRRRAGLLVMPTTVQAYPHPFQAIARNALKRAAPGNLWRFVVHGRSMDWPTIAESLLHQAVRHGGVFHIWGHSWELQSTGQWGRLEDVLRFMSTCIGEPVSSLTNGEICRIVRSIRPS
jgi:peptidoglycan-N-acetylglucosamine deacetylase